VGLKIGGRFAGAMIATEGVVSQNQSQNIVVEAETMILNLDAF
jgi:cytoskeletal protein CcmA (bactofilin family)